MKRIEPFMLLALITITDSHSQHHSIKNIELTAKRGLGVASYTSADDQRVVCRRPLPFFSFEVNDTMFHSLGSRASLKGDSATFSFPFGISGTMRIDRNFQRGWEATVTFRNTSRVPKQISNVLPFGVREDHTYIISTGPHTGINRLSRSQLFRPKYGPIGVLLPDNAWELGYCDVEIAPNRSLTAIARRTGAAKADVRRFRTILEPGGSLEYVFYVDEHVGDWRSGLEMMFRERWLYDLQEFDNTLFEREDLKWIRHSYLMLIQFAWDQTYYDAVKGEHAFDRFFTSKNDLIGGFDVFIIWPTWPRLGLDQRNQFDLYRDLPGGVEELRRQAELTHRLGAKYFISYNPWDESTRYEDHLRGMENLLRTVDADGVVLDTQGESSKEFQDTADRVKPGIIMYSEGMAIPKDMPGIVAGRVHDALYMPPPLNLNKYIKPEFGIFRVMQVAEGKLHREIAVAFFNGYGTEINIMRPGRPDWIDEELRYLGITTKILQENSSAFLDPDWTPLLETTADSIWVNRWLAPEKTVYTIFNLRPEGFQGPLFEARASDNTHYVSLWHHEELNIIERDHRTFVPSKTDGFSRAWLGTRDEGNVDCIAEVPRLLDIELNRDSLRLSAPKGTKIIVSAGNPSYSTKSASFATNSRAISLTEHLGTYEGKVVVQLFDERELLDERVVNVELATPRLISRVERTPTANAAPPGMVEIPAGTFTFRMSGTSVPNPIIPYPDYSTPHAIEMKRFFIDQYPVTNGQFKEFLDATRYWPKDTTNFLRHWVNGEIPKGMEKHPVVSVSLEDAKAYARWAGKRLPTGIEWQYAAQGTDGRKYPWGNELDSTKCNNALGMTIPVDAFPEGKSPFGAMDLVGNVWQLTNDVYDNGSYFFVMLRGGSYYYPRSSIWYVTGGPWPVDQHQMLLMVSSGFDRSLTVGFRCVKDAE